MYEHSVGGVLNSSSSAWFYFPPPDGKMFYVAQLKVSFVIVFCSMNCSLQNVCSCINPTTTATQELSMQIKGQLYLVLKNGLITRPWARLEFHGIPHTRHCHFWANSILKIVREIRIICTAKHNSSKLSPRNRGWKFVSSRQFLSI